MISQTQEKQAGRRATTRRAGAALLATLIVLGSMSDDREAAAGPATVGAAQSADAGISACANNNNGKPLYNCVANVLNRLSGEISDVQVPAVRGALSAAASRLRAAVTKAQSLSAITQCQAAISGALRQVAAMGGGRGNRGGSAPGLEGIASVLSHAASVIQSKG